MVCTRSEVTSRWLGKTGLSGLSLPTQHFVALSGRSAGAKAVSRGSQQRPAIDKVHLTSVCRRAYRLLHAHYWRTLSHRDYQTLAGSFRRTVVASIAQKKLPDGYHAIIRESRLPHVCSGHQMSKLANLLHQSLGNIPKIMYFASLGQQSLHIEASNRLWYRPLRHVAFHTGDYPSKTLLSASSLHLSAISPHTQLLFDRTPSSVTRPHNNSASFITEMVSVQTLETSLGSCLTFSGTTKKSYYIPRLYCFASYSCTAAAMIWWEYFQVRARLLEQCK